MSPFTITDKSRRGPQVWRALVLINSVAVAAALVIGIGFYSLNSNAIRDNTELACRIGAFFIGQPIVRAPQQSRDDFRLTVLKSESFLGALKQRDCSDVAGARVTNRQIHDELRQLHKIVPEDG